jgi:hypothetical protein
MKARVERLLRFQDSEGDMDKLAHHGANDELGQFA